jgi:hypothetical protein
MKKLFPLAFLFLSLNCLSKEVTLVCDATVQYIGEFDVGKAPIIHFEIDFDEKKNTLSHRGLDWTCKGFHSDMDRKVIKETGEINKKSISFGCKSENLNAIVTAKYFESNFYISRSSGKLSAWNKSTFEDKSSFFRIDGTCNLAKDKF